MKRLWLFSALAALACNLPVGASATPTPLPPTTPERVTAPPGDNPPPTNEPEAAIEPVNPLPALLESVSAERLVGHVETLAAIETRHVNSPTIAQAADYIRAQFEAADGRIVVRDEEFPLTFNGVTTTQRNIVAVLPGGDPAAGMIVVGAHYDSRTADVTHTTRAPGADDNASGVAAVIEIARLLADLPLRHTVALVAFSAEEINKGGSTFYVQQAIARGETIEAMIALDIIGNAAGAGGENAIRVFSPEPNDSPSRTLARYAATRGEAAVPGFDVAVQARADRPNRWSDHYPFFEAGIPAVRFISLLEDVGRQHSADDTPDRLSPDYLRRATQVALATVVHLADGPPAPGPPALEGDTLTWPPVEGAAGYVVAIRGADSLEFDVLIEVAGATALTSDTLVDERYAFASVAAVDARGLVSRFSVELSLGD